MQVGDFVQWTSDGIDQFKVPRKVVGLFPGGTHAQVFGSNTGVPLSELTVVDPPATPAPMSHPSVAASSSMAYGTNDLNVLQRGDRLQITADVDLEGLQELQDILKHYEAILTRLAARKQK